MKKLRAGYMMILLSLVVAESRGATPGEATVCGDYTVVSETTDSLAARRTVDLSGYSFGGSASFTVTDAVGNKIKEILRTDSGVRFDYVTAGDTVSLSRIEWRDRYLQPDSLIPVSCSHESEFAGSFRQFQAERFYVKGVASNRITMARQLILSEGDTVDNPIVRHTRLSAGYYPCYGSAAGDSAVVSGILSAVYFYGDDSGYPLAVAYRESMEGDDAEESPSLLCRFLPENHPNDKSTENTSRPKRRNAERSGALGPEVTVSVRTEHGCVEVALPADISDVTDVSLCDMSGRLLRRHTSQPPCTVRMTEIATGHYVVSADWPGGRYGETVYVP